MSYIEGTHLEEIIDRTVDGWSKILGLVEVKPKRTKRTRKQVTHKVDVVDDEPVYADDIKFGESS